MPNSPPASSELNPSVEDGEPVMLVDMVSAFAELDRMLPAQLKSEIKNGGASPQHRSLGMWLRNNWGLWDTRRFPSKGRLRNYFLVRGIKHPDEMSSVLLDCYCSQLRGQDVIEPPLLDGDELLRATRKIRLKVFFQSLVDAAKQEGFIGLHIPPQPYRTFVPTGIRGVAFYVTFTSTTLRVEICFQSQSDKVNKTRFDAIALKRDEIDKSLDRKLSWERRDDQIISCIALLHDGSIDCPPDELAALCSWAIAEMKLMHEKLLPQVLIASEQTS